MNFKQFLKPDRRKIGLSIILFILLIDFFIFLENPFVFHGDGFPFPYRYYPQPPIPRNTHQIIMPFLPIFIWGYFILDIFICGLISYFLSFFRSWQTDKQRKQKEKKNLFWIEFCLTEKYQYQPPNLQSRRRRRTEEEEEERRAVKNPFSLFPLSLT